MKSTNDMKKLQRPSLRLALCALAFSAAIPMMGQMKTLKGKVVDHASKAPLAGIQLQALGQIRYTAMTDEDGTFTIKVPEHTTALYVHSDAYMAQQVSVAAYDSTQTVAIEMLSDKFAPLYGKGTDITAKNEFTVGQTAATVDQEIGNKLGADIRSIVRSGAVEGGAAMFIRGLNSINSNSMPLIVLDGIELDMQYTRASLHDGHFNNMLANISPDDIEKVTVLKNATALYGARGANGVILIETKRGHSMATRIDANISVGVALVPQTQTMMNASQYRTYATEMLGTMSELDGRNIPFRFLNDDPNGYYYNIYHNDTDWQDNVYRTALTQNYSINVQGGDDVGMYNLSVGYMDTEGNVENTGFNRMNLRFNTDIEVFKGLQTKFDISIARTSTKLFDDGFPGDFSQSTITAPANLAAIKSPLVTPYQYNSIIGGFTSLLSSYDDIFSQIDNGTKYSLANPVAIIENGEGDNKNIIENTNFSVRVAPTYTFKNGIKVGAAVSYVLNRNTQRYFRPFEGVPPFKVEGVNTYYSKVGSLFAEERNLAANGFVAWAKNFGRHNIAATAGFRYNNFSLDANNLSTEFTSEKDDKNPKLETEGGATKGINESWTNIQWYGSADYNYMNRYFATVSLLGEANSRFGENAGGLGLFGVQWALFPSVQLGWVMTNEKWFPKNSGINYLRLSAGFDMSGNDDIDNYAARSSYSAVLFHNTKTGLQLTNIGNDEIQWETTTKWNIGLQSRFLNNRLAVNFDYYIHNTSNLLTLQTFNNPVAGINRYWTNGGKLRNTGFEVTVSGKPVVTKDWRVEVGASVGHYKNEITELPDGSFETSAYGATMLTSVGNPVGLFYGYKTAGVFADNAEASTAGKDGYLYLEDAAGAHKNFYAGDVHFVDINGDGAIDAKDRTVIGDPNPDIYGNIFASVNWKDLTLSLGFNYSLGNDVYNYQRSILNSGATLYNQQVAEVGHWRYEGQQTELPRVAYGDPMGNNRFSDRWIEDGSYLRLKTVNLSYRVPVPSSWTWLQGLTVWAEAHNLFTLTKYTGNDPEFSIGNSVYYQGIDCGTLAQSRSFTFGVKINL
jgi:TonB-linked SusC/RagA family outer membrane protein